MRVVAALTLWFGVAVFGREAIEETMLGHALGQLPLLVVVGWWLIPAAPPDVRASEPHPLSVPVLLVAVFSALLWMLPRMLDAALSDPWVEVAKLTTIPLLVGSPLGWSWPRLTGLARAFVWANGLSMLLTLGWLLKAAPLRVCNFYLVDEQQWVGNAYLTIAAAIVAFWLPRLFLGADASPTALSAEAARQEPPREALYAHRASR